MSKNRRQELEKCESGTDFERYVRRQPEVEKCHQCGSHLSVTTRDGMAVIPVHSKDLGHGIRAKIVKTLIAIGLGTFLIVQLF